MGATLIYSDDSEGALPEYPYPADLRLEAHSWMAFHFDRWLNSHLRLMAARDVRAVAIDLFCISQHQTPVGTLPDDLDEIAALLGTTRHDVDDLCSRKVGILHNWYRCTVEGEVRRAHGVVLEVIGEALESQDAAAERLDSGQRRMKTNRLVETLRALGHMNLAGNPVHVESIYEWLVQFGPKRELPTGRVVPGKWTAKVVSTAVENCTVR